MDPLQGNEALQQFMKLLEENDRAGQAADLSQLLWYMDGMSRQFDAVVKELQEVKAQLAYEKQPAVQKVMQGAATNLENKVDWARNMLAGLRERIVDCARNAVESFKEAGVSALDKAVSAMGVKNVLESVQDHLSGMVADMKRNIEKVESIGHELRSVGGHLKNAGRAVTGKEALVVDGGQAGRFQSVVLAPMRAVQKLLTNMNNTTLATIGSVENLEQSAETVRKARAERAAQKPGKRLEKKTSIRQDLEKKKAQASARPAPEQAARGQEAVL